MCAVRLLFHIANLPDFDVQLRGTHGGHGPTSLLVTGTESPSTKTLAVLCGIASASSGSSPLMVTGAGAELVITTKIHPE